MIKKNNIQLIKRSLVFENSIYKVFSDSVADQRGNSVSDYLSVESGSQSEQSVAGVCVLPYNQRKLLLIKIHRHPLGSDGFEVIKGHIDNGESPKDAALRELDEESGIKCKLNALTECGSVAPESGLLKGRTMIFFAEVPNLTAKTHDYELGHDGVRLFNHTEVDSLIDKGKIEDATSLVAIMRFQNRYRNTPSNF